MSIIDDLLKAVDGLLATCEAVEETEGGVQSLAELREWRGKVAALAADAENPAMLIHFETSNEAMRSEDAVADQLDFIADYVRRGFTSGALKDGNGNTVGSWSVEIPEPVED